MKKFIITFGIFLFFFLNIQNKNEAFASTINIVDVKVNDQYINFSEPPFIFKGATYVPIRSFSEILNAEVNWNANSRVADIKKENSKLEIYPDHKKAVFNNDEVHMNGSAILYKDRIFVPLRFITEIFGGSIKWDSFHQNACVSLSEANIASDMVNYNYTDDDILWLGRIIESESASEPFLGKTAVGSVVLNRVISDEFPNTIYGVIFDKKHGVQFQPVLNGSIYNTPTYESVAAAKYALKGERPVDDCLYFLNPKTAENFWIINNREFHATIENHDFYL